MSKERKLTAYQQSYVNNRIKGMNPTEAYRKSKYSTKKMSTKAVYAEAHRLDNHPLISLKIKEGSEKATNAAIMKREEALEILTQHARVTITDICNFELVEVGDDKEGNPVKVMKWVVKDCADIDPKVAACIKSITIMKDGPKIEIYDTDGAIKQLRAMEGWDAPEKKELFSPDGSMSPRSFNDFYDDEQADS